MNQTMREHGGPSSYYDGPTYYDVLQCSSCREEFDQAVWKEGQVCPHCIKDFGMDEASIDCHLELVEVKHDPVY